MRLIIFLLALSLSVQADECSHLWRYEIKIDPTQPKGYVGDTWAAYSLMGYRYKANLGWKFVTEFPRARFMSVQTYITQGKNHYDAKFDYEFEPNEGSENPFKLGAAIQTPNRSVEMRLIPGVGHSTVPNVIHISPTEEIQSVYYRIYVPSNGVTVTEADFPKIYAYDVTTGAPMSCPEFVNVVYAPDDSQMKVAWVPPTKNFKFRSVKESIFSETNDQGHNAAIPDYLFALNRISKGNVAVVKFKAPTFFNTASGTGPFEAIGNVRYWSLCTLNIDKGMTLNCLADFESKPDASGFVTVVVGSKNVKQAAEKRGYSFLEDKRGRDQKVMQFLYRNLLPENTFEKHDMYKNDYEPKGTTCSETTFIKSGC